MSHLNQKKLNYKKNKKHQTIWSYIRRNPHFRVGEIIMVCDVSLGYFKKYIKELEAAEYIVLRSKFIRPYSNREYSLLNNTGAAAPKIIPEGLLDENTGKTIVLYEEKVVHMPELLPDILEAMKTNDSATKVELCKAAGVTRKKLNDWWKVIEKLGVIKDKFCEMGNQKIVDVYIFDSKRVREIIKELKNGAYSEDEPELRNLWMH
ncbi:MAG: hypothetical protein C0625_10515 [Arcobacter sp.]|nr:MAG: hypothetical protein C0625_10515 [Arcobacter sp.]